MPTRIARLALTGAAIGLLAAAGASQVPDPAAPELAYHRDEGQNINAFVRQGTVAAHLLLRNGTAPRILVAFPAGNSGVALWFDAVARPAAWTLTQPPRPVTRRDGRGRALHGIEAAATIATPRLAIRQAVLSNVRFLRDFEAIGRVPADILVAPQISGDRIVYARDRVDGAPGYRLELTVTEGRIADGAILAGSDGRIGLAFTALTGDTPLTGFSERALFTPRAAADPAARHALAFLSYREKFLAGSWRFDTYFGRDTLMSLRLLMPALRPEAIEAGLGSVLARMNAGGEVAHEEGLSEFAILERRANGDASSPQDAPTLDYAMVDDDFMLAPVVAAYLLEHAGTGPARAFLSRPVASVARPGDRHDAGTILVRNLRYVLAQARPFAERPSAAALIAIPPGKMTGQWRDSNEGIGRGRYAYDVNAVFVPAALEAAAALMKAELLDAHLSREDRAELAKAAAMAAVWRARAPGLFRVEVPSDRARASVGRYAAAVGVPAASALDALGSVPLVFHAIALDGAGRPVPIIHSDEGFELLFGHPSAADLDTYVPPLARPFPAGLMTGIGLLVANAGLADAEVQARFTPGAYHGAVVWSWQQALMAAGLERQLARSDLPPPTRTMLRRVQAELWRAIDATAATRNSELWSWAYENGRYRVVAFGAGKKDVDESNAAQLWSTVYLAVRPPRR